MVVFGRNHVTSPYCFPLRDVAASRYRIFRRHNAPGPSLPLFHLDPPIMLHCTIGEDNTSLSIDSSSDVSRILASTVYKQNIPSIFDSAGLQRSAVDIKVPTTGGFYISTLDLIVSYGLPSDIVLGSDWSIPYCPVPIDEPPFFSRPSLDTIQSLRPPHGWRATNGMRRPH